MLVCAYQSSRKSGNPWPSCPEVAAAFWLAENKNPLLQAAMPKEDASKRRFVWAGAVALVLLPKAQNPNRR
jgi:hypothetical protein